MNTKLLIGLAVALGLLLFALLGPRIETEDPKLDIERELVGGGHFIVERSGVILLEETYTLFFDPVDGYMLLSQSEVTSGDRSISLSQQTQYDREFLPIFYHLAADTPTGPQIVSAQMGVTGLTMEVRVGSSRQAVEVPATEDLAPGNCPALTVSVPANITEIYNLFKRDEPAILCGHLELLPEATLGDK